MTVSSTSTQAPPLTGIRVLELGHFLAGPFATAILADFGAEVIKVELPGRPDISRYMFGPKEALDPERSLLFATMSRGKKAITLDYRRPQGLDLLLRLVAESDVLAENFRPGQLESWGLGYDVLHKVNPRLVLLRISGFGQTGSASLRPGVDDVAQAFAGATHMTGFEDEGPVKSGLTIADHGAGVHGALGVCLALLARDRAGDGGAGQEIDVALYDSVLQLLDDMPSSYVRTGAVRTRVGNEHDYATPINAFQTKDERWIVITAASDSLFARLAAVIGDEAWINSESYATMEGRLVHRAEINETLRRWAAARTADDALASLQQGNVPCQAINDMRALVDEPQVRERGDLIHFDDEHIGELLLVAPKPLLSRTPGSVRHRAPRIGEHNEEILRNVLGMSDSDFETLSSEGVI